MSNTTKKKVLIVAICTIAVLIVALSGFLLMNGLKEGKLSKSTVLDNEIRRAQTYKEITDNDAIVENCEYVQFSSFFTRDLDGDGYAERYDGTCNHISKKATLYFDINVLTDGELRNGKISIGGRNFSLSTSLVRDDVLKNDYIGSDISTIELNDVLTYGSQKLFSGIVSANIGSNINNYSNTENTVRLTGTWVSTDGNNSVEIDKTIKLTVDWYGRTVTVPYRYHIETTHDINDMLGQEALTFNFNVGYEETVEELIIQKQVTEVTIPQFNGYDPIPESVRTTSQNVTQTYKDGVLRIERIAEVSDKGNVTKNVSRSNLYSIEVKYPLEAYENWGGEIVSLVFPTVGYYYGYNNSSAEFANENPYISQASRTYTHVWREKRAEPGKFYSPRLDVYVGTKTYNPYEYSYKYVISKEKPLNIYNEVGVEEETPDRYTVQWVEFAGNVYADQIGLTMEETEPDKFLKADGTYIDMKDYVRTAGIYFYNLDNVMADDDGWIKVYDKDTNDLLVTFTKADWGKYSSNNPYEFITDVRSIRVETSKVKENSYFYVYQVKEIDDYFLIENFYKEEFDDFNFIYSYLKGGVITGDSTKEISPDAERAYYEAPISIASFSVTPNAISNQETKNITMKIDTSASRFNSKKWTNGQFLIEFPKEILDVQLKDIKCSNSSVEIISSEVYEENDKYFIKIYTENDIETTYSLTINADVTADPREATVNKTINLYAINQGCPNYETKSNDIFDMNGNWITEEKVLYRSANLSIIAPSSLLTVQTLSNFDDSGKEIVSPQVAIIDKSSNVRDARINVTVTNNYSGTISEVVIVGKIPFEGNSYQINRGELGSTYSVSMKDTGITVPDAIKDITTVYYSTNEIVTNDISDPSNNWKTADQVEDWSLIKTYAIDLSKYTLQRKDSLTFSYDIVVPVKVNYNDVSYSTHGVYFCLDTADGKLKTRTEVNRLGVMIAKKFNLEVTKYKSGTNTKVQGATYKVNEGNNTRTGVTNAEGKTAINGLFVEREYTLKEIASPDSYILNTDEIRFKIVIDDEGNPQLELVGNVKGEATISDIDGVYTLNIDVEDIAKYDVKIVKKDSATGDLLKGVKFRLKGGVYGDFGRIFTTKENGEISILNLIPGTEYTIQETKADGYYVKQDPITFKITRNAEGVLEITSSDAEFQNANIVEADGVAKAVVNVDVTNEKIPLYSLNINKKNDKDELLSKTQFKLTSIDTGDIYYGITDENGRVSFDGLYQFVTGKYVTGEYVLQEILATEGYITDTTEIKFKAEKDADDNLKITILEGNDAVSAQSSDSTSITFDIVNNPIFKLTKTGDNGKLLPNVKFKITDLNGNTAVDVNGNPIGTLEGIPPINVVFPDDIQSGSYKWTQMDDGTLKSGGYHVSSAISTLRSEDFTVAEEGKLSFDWVVSSESISYDYLYYTITNLDTNDTYGTGISTKIGGRNGDNETDEQAKSRFVHVTKTLQPGRHKIEFTYRKDGSGNYGADAGFVRDVKIEGSGYYYLKTDKNGEITASLPNGMYKIEEMEVPEGYQLPEKEEDRIHYVGIGESRPEESEFRMKFANSIKGNGHSNIYDMKAMSDGGYVVTGTFQGELDVDGDGTVDETATGDTDAYIAKFDKDGIYQWHYVYGTVGEDGFNRIDVTNDGGYVAVGYEYTDTYRDTLIVKVDDSGNEIWRKNIVSFPNTPISDAEAKATDMATVATRERKYAYDDELTGVKVLSNGQIVVTGRYFGGDVKIGEDVLPNESRRYQGFVAWLDSEGNNVRSHAITAADTGASNSPVKSNVNVTDVTVTNNGIVISVDYIGKLNVNGAQIADTAALQQDTAIIRYSLDGDYQGNVVIGGTNTESISRLITDNEDNIVALGGYGTTLTLGSDTLTAKSTDSNGMMLKYSSIGEYISSYTLPSSSMDAKLTSAVSTPDGGLLIGGWYYSTTLDVDGDGTNDITSNKGCKDGILIKLKEDGNVDWYKTIAGSSFDGVNAVTVLKDGSYVASGSFESPTLAVDTQSSALTLQGYTDGFMAAWGKVVTAAAIPQLQEINVTNELKKHKITTEIDVNSDTERVGGTITGTPTKEENINLVEEVKYGYNGEKQIVITPDASYSVFSVKINNETYNFTPDENGVVTIPVFENVKEDYHIKVVFEKNISSVLVHHYKIDREGNKTTEKLADDEYYTGKVNTKYETAPRIDIDGYDVERGITGNPILPDNATGTYQDDQIVVTYYYKEVPFELTVHHYLEGTEEKLIEDTVEQKYKGDTFEVNPDSGLLESYYLVGELTTVNLEDDKYTKDDNNKVTGAIEQDTVITYYYKLKEYNITTKVNPITIMKYNELTNEYEEVVLRGGRISGENENPYEIVPEGQDSYKEKKAIPDDGFRVKRIEINGEEIEFTPAEDGTVTLDQFTDMREDKEISVEFEPIQGTVIVHHYIEGETTPVPLNDGSVAQDETRVRYVGEPYATKPLENLAEGYECVSSLGETSGNYIDGTIEVIYYYKITEIIRIIGSKAVETANGLDYAVEGEELTYTITVKNEGTHTRTVVVKDKAPDGTEFVSNSIKINGNTQSGKVESDLETGLEVVVDSGNEATVSFKVKVNELPEGVFTKEIKNTAIVNEEETNEVTTTVNKPNVVASKSSNPASGSKVKKKDEITYYIKLDNTTGTAPATVKVKDSAPEGTAFKAGSVVLQSSVAGSEVEDLSATTEAELTAGIDITVEAGEIKTLSFTVTVIDLDDESENDLTNGDKITNIAKVNKNPEDPTSKDEDVGPVEHVYIEPIISQVKGQVTANGHTYVEEGEKITYTITVTNEGGLGKDVVVKDSAPAGTTFVEGSVKVNGQSSYIINGERIDLTAKGNADLITGLTVNVPAKAGETNGQATVSFEVTVDELATGEYSKTIKNTATVDDNDTNEVTTVVNKAEIVGEKTVDPEGNVQPGQELTYRIKVSNKGTLVDTATVTDTIPAHTTYVPNSVKVGDKTYTDSDLIAGKDGIKLVTDIDNATIKGITAEDITVEGGKAVVISFKVKVNPETANGTKVTNTAVVNGTPTTPVENTVIKSIINVEKEIAEINGQTERLDYVFRGDTITYNIKATNEGDLAGKVIIKDTIPEGTDFVSGSIKINGVTSSNTDINLANGIEIAVPEKAEGKAGEASISFTVKVKGTTTDLDGVTGDIENKAIWKEKANPENPTEPEEHETNIVKVPIVVFKKVAEINRTTTQEITEGAVTAKDEIIYKIVVENTGTKDVGELIVTDTIPEGTTLQNMYEITDTNVTNTENQNDTITWTIDSLLAQTSSTVGFRVTVNYDKQATKQIPNTAYVNEKLSNEVTTLYEKPESKLTTEITKTGDEVAIIGNNIHYAITYKATVEDFVGKANLTIVDKLPYEIDVDKSILGVGELDSGKGTYNKENKTITWTIPINSIDTYTNGNPYEIIVTKELSLYYKTTRTLEGEIINIATGTTNLKEPNPENPEEDVMVKTETKEDTHTVTAKAISELPATGGNGMIVFMMVGMILVAFGSAIVVTIDKRKDAIK